MKKIMENTTSVMKASIIPEPREVLPKKGECCLPTVPVICCPAAWKSEAELLAGELNSAMEITATIRLDGTKGALVFTKAELPPEAYELQVTARGIKISAGDASGAYYAIQTLRQWLPKAEAKSGRRAIACVIIRDAPRFCWRALMIDPARHIWRLEDIRAYIEVMAFYKFNKLHLHLTDDQGWRLTCDKWPKLTTVAAWRRETNGDGKRHGGIYRRQELQDLVAFAARHHVEIIPEVDVPGHNQALLAAYPEFACFPRNDFEVRTTPGVSEELLCPCRKVVYEFYTDLFHELAKIFPSPYVHLGGDEAPLTRWEVCPGCRSLRQTEGLATAREEMGWFFRKMAGLLEKHGKRPLFWFENDVAGYPKNSVMYTWRMGKTPEVMQLTREGGWPLICSPGEHAYFNFPQAKEDVLTHHLGPITTLEQVYQFDPGYGLLAEQQNHVCGAEATLWGETVPDLDTAFHMTYPRGLAFAEACWSEMSRREWRRFKQKLPGHLCRLDCWQVQTGPML